MLDEPTSELDPKSSEEVLSIVQRLNDELGITIILIEHRLDRVIQHTDRLMVLDGGRIVIDGNTRDVLHRNYQEISDAGVGMPPVIRLAHQLEVMGITDNKTPLTVKEGRMALQGVFQKTSGQFPRRDEKSVGKPVIEVKKLWHAYPDGSVALKNVSLVIGEGEFVAIMGRNASGKTTLIKHFNGLLKPTKGSVTIQGIDTRKATIAELARRIGFVFQNPNDHLFADTVEEEISFTLKNLGLSDGEIRSRIDEVLERFRLDEYRRQYPRALSGGEKQRVALASVLAVQPKILILDEPTRGMEYRLKAELMNFLHEYAAQGKTVVLVTHDVETVAEYADRVVLLGEGGVVVDGSKRDVLSRALLFSPQINRLAQAFERYGVPGDVLTVDEVLHLLK
jgi:energy-coupling factor transport system ATP-binding protein